MAEKGGRQERLSPDYAANVRMMDDILRVRDNFDVIRKDMQIGRDRITLYYIDGFVKDSVMEKLMIFFLSLKRLVPEESGAPGESPLPVQRFVDAALPYVETDVSRSVDSMVLMVSMS